MDLFKETRLQKIMELLRERRALTTADLRQLLGVSSMTIHRDLSELAGAGLVERVHGGVLLAGAAQSNSTCAHCGKDVNPRTAFVLHLKDGQALQACCPHCGLRLLDSHPDAVSGMAVDFLHGTMSNIKTAAFLLHPDLVVCCAPSVFVFARREEAERMQAGFGGRVLDLPLALEEIRREMHLHHPPSGNH
jgi:DeoR/GlpR family transcriptional regulator of sugar metabolism